MISLFAMAESRSAMLVFPIAGTSRIIYQSPPLTAIQNVPSVGEIKDVLSVVNDDF
jgi:hypothetical protein